MIALSCLSTFLVYSSLQVVPRRRSQRGTILFKASKANKASIHRIAFGENLLLATSLPSENHHHPLITHTNQPLAIRTPAHLRRGKMRILVR